MNNAESLYAVAQTVLPGGVTASFRVNRAIGRPFYVARGDGPYVYDLEGRQSIDMCLSHGASLLGHNHPQLKAAVAQALDWGIICSYENEQQVLLAQQISELVPCAEMVRFAGSGTETVMHALRLARTATGRKKILKFEGHFHGYSDALNYSVSPPLAAAGPIEAPLAYPESAGVPGHNRDQLIIVPFNHIERLEAVFAAHGKELAALILEPINYDQGCILPQPGFVQRCRELCDHYGVLLFFDEVLTAFRMAPGGAQQYLGVTPDLCVLGKALGAGMPISAIAGKRFVMEHLKPLGGSEMSGTYLAHLTGIMAARAALTEYSSPGFYERLDAVGEYFYSGFQRIIEQSGVAVRLQYLGPRFGLYFGVRDAVTNYRQAAQKNRVMELTFIKSCIEQGVYFHPSPHHGFSAAHTEADMDRVLAAAEVALAAVKAEFTFTG
ncbi:MAG: aminotransferase class III-fold pyridoxal phosphate-dependent enzyme [Caldilineaceae bacterium]|nr:aminotransferase class III-fold pyridoxal phosphate-dependent enzyme [Caldilineaceae bacterium]